jgi:Arylsulfotransferase (ASST)/Secretion system C-terminal sorting domain
MKRLIFTLSCLPLFILTTAKAQHTIGLLSYQPAKSFDGYNLLYPHNQPNVYLLDNCGEIVHVWPDDATWRPGNTVYILDNGDIVKTKRPAPVAGNPIWTGGGGGIVEVRDWDNNLIWDFEMNDSLNRLHHDISVMPNGNILMIAWQRKTLGEILQAGFDTSLLVNDVLWPDRVIEVSRATKEIVWEWYAWDHLIQDFDDTKDNFGDVTAHPELIDANWDTGNSNSSWMHTNSIDYDGVNDHILLSVPRFDEVWIIDHSTTTQQAAGHTGGFGGAGGDLLYRWGNPATYRAGGSMDQKLFFQHDAHYLDDFVEQAHPHFGKVAIFNNRFGVDYSGANIFAPPFDMYEGNFPMTGNVWGPADYDWSFTYPGDPAAMYSTGLSSVQLLRNGNYLICSGRQGYSFEVTPDDEIVWEYVTPLKAGNPATQGDTLAVGENLTFRVQRYPAGYTAFEGRDLSQKGWIELNPDTSFCDQILPAGETFSEYHLKIFPNPANDMLMVEWKAGLYVELEVFDYLGRKMEQTMHLSGGRKYLDTSRWLPGLYFVRINRSESAKVLIVR